MVRDAEQQPVHAKLRVQVDGHEPMALIMAGQAFVSPHGPVPLPASTNSSYPGMWNFLLFNYRSVSTPGLTAGFVSHSLHLGMSTEVTGFSVRAVPGEWR